MTVSVRDSYRSTRDTLRERGVNPDERKGWQTDGEARDVAALLVAYGLGGQATAVLQELVSRRVASMSDVRWAAMRVREGL